MNESEIISGLATIEAGLHPEENTRTNLRRARRHLANTLASMRNISHAHDPYDGLDHAKRSIVGMVNDINEMLRFLDETS